MKKTTESGRRPWWKRFSTRSMKPLKQDEITRADDEIDKLMKKSKEHSRKLFFLGVGESGKKTLCDQINFIYNGKLRKMDQSDIAQDVLEFMLDGTAKLYGREFDTLISTVTDLKLVESVLTVKRSDQYPDSLDAEGCKKALSALQYIWMEWDQVWDDWKRHITRKHNYIEVTYFTRKLDDPMFLDFLRCLTEPKSVTKEITLSKDESIAHEKGQEMQSEDKTSEKDTIIVNDEEEKDQMLNLEYYLRCRSRTTGMEIFCHEKGSVKTIDRNGNTGNGKAQFSNDMLIILHWTRVECELSLDFWYSDIFQYLDDRISEYLHRTPKFQFDEDTPYRYEWILVGSQRSERKKWNPEFSETDIYLYVSSFTFSVTVLFEDYSQNSLLEDLQLFRNTIERHRKPHSKCVLIMTKEDTLRELIKMDIRLDEHWPVPYDGPVYSDKASQARMSDEQWLDHCTESVMSQIESLYLSIPGAQSFVSSVLRINPLDTLDVATKLLSSHMFRLFDQDGPPPSSAAVAISGEGGLL